jgi:hypothetical protein
MCETLLPLYQFLTSTMEARLLGVLTSVLTVNSSPKDYADAYMGG